MINSLLKIDINKRMICLSEDFSIEKDIEIFKYNLHLDILKNIKPNKSIDYKIYNEIKSFIQYLIMSKYYHLEYSEKFYHIRSKYKKSKRKKLYLGEFRKHCLFILRENFQDIKIDTREFIK